MYSNRNIFGNHIVLYKIYLNKRGIKIVFLSSVHVKREKERDNIHIFLLIPENEIILVIHYFIYLILDIRRELYNLTIFSLFMFYFVHPYPVSHTIDTLKWFKMIY